jgi:hypothetical protein
LADKRISELTALTGANVADDDAIAIVDTSATETKKIVFSELKTALDSATGFVRITGDTMTGALDVQSTITSDGLTVDHNTGGPYNVDKSLSSYSSTNGVYLNGNASGWLRLNNDGTGSTKIDLYGSSYSEANVIKMYSASNERLSIDANGDISFYDDQGSSQSFYWDASAESLGIGTTSPSGASGKTLAINGGSGQARLALKNTSTGDASGDGFQISIGTDGSAGIEQRENSYMAFLTNASEAMRISSDGSCRWTPDGSNPDMTLDASGNLLVGTTDGVAHVTSASGEGIALSAGSYGGFIGASRSGDVVVALNRQTNDGDILRLYKDGSTVGSIGTTGGDITVGSGDTGLRFGQGTDQIWPVNGTTTRDAAVTLGWSGGRFKDLYLSSKTKYQASGGNQHSVGVDANDLIIRSETAGSETARFTYGGDLLVGAASATGQYNGTGSNGMSVVLAGQAGQYVPIQNETDSNLYLTKKTGYTNNIAINFAVAGSSVGTVTVSASATAYNTSSDYRLKENVVDLTGATTRLKQLEPKRFNFIADADTTVDGFLAHEVQTVVPEAITGTLNEVDADGNPVYQGIDQSKLVPLLVATIKELEARITALENA